MIKKILLFCSVAIGLFFVTSCSRPSVTISGCIEGGAKSKITLMHQGATTQRLLDTLRADGNGCFRYKIKSNDNTFEPMFVSLSVDDEALATLLVEKGEQLKITATKGVYDYTVEGSEGSRLLQLLNKDLYDASHRFDSLTACVAREQALTGTTKIPENLNKELGSVYVSQYRSAIRFMANNPRSLACVAALNERLPNGLPVFSSNNDAIRFKIVYDSLVVYYPHSEYVLALRDEYEYRFNQLDLMDKMNAAKESGFVDINLPNTSAENIALSSFEGNVILVYFWLSANKEQLMFNNELKQLYDTYRSKGFTIYQIALDTDKAIWAKAVADQQLPWVNVCDGLGAASSAVKSYAIKNLPAAFLINKKGDIVAANIAQKDIAKKVGELLR